MRRSGGLLGRRNWRCWSMFSTGPRRRLGAFLFLMAKGACGTNCGGTAFGVDGAELGHLNTGGVDQPSFCDLTELSELPFEGTGKQTGAHRIGQASAFRGIVRHVVREWTQVQRPGHGGRSKGPRPMLKMHVEVEAALCAGPEGADRHQGADVLPVFGDDTSLNAAKRDGRFVAEKDLNFEDVFVVVVDFHSDRQQPGLDGSDARAVLLRHASREGHSVLECGADGLQRRPSLVSDGRDQSTAATVWCARSTPVRYSAPAERAFQRSRAPNQNQPTRGIR